MLACPPVKGSRLQRVVLFFFFSSRVCSLTFFFIWTKSALLSYTRMCVCVRFAFFVSPLQWLTKCNRCMCRLFAVSFYLFFFSLLLFLYQAQVNERRRRTNGSFSFLFTQTNSVDSFSITNIFYHLIYQLVYAIQFYSYFNLS